MKIAIHRPGAFNTDCTHQRVRHRHGTIGSYRQDGCGCDECREANRRDQIMWKLRPNTLTPAAPTAARLRAFRAAGWTWQKLADKTGCTPSHLVRIASGKVTRVTTSTMKAVAAIPMGPPDILVVRRLQALAAIGWTAAEMAALFEVSQGAIHAWRARGRTPSPALLKRIETRWGAASVQPKTGHGAACAITHARKNGWAPPAAWDDIDDPNETPKGVPGTPPSLTKNEDIAWLIEQGETRQAIAQRFKITEAAVDRAWFRHKKAA